jgi:predicted DNA-binding transcriptional regulator AlpA
MDLLNRRAAAAYLSVSPSTLSKWAAAGTGPRVLRVGHSVRYARADLSAFVAGSLKPAQAL